MFPTLASTRFRNLSEFYTLFLIVWEMNEQKLVLNDRKLNAVAMKLLTSFKRRHDVRERQKKAKGARFLINECTLNYLLLVQQSTDSLAPRKRRAEMIRHLLSGIFEHKDEKRIFSVEQGPPFME